VNRISWRSTIARLWLGPLLVAAANNPADADRFAGLIENPEVARR
jgi:hypothetical protein